MTGLPARSGRCTRPRTATPSLRSRRRARTGPDDLLLVGALAADVTAEAISARSAPRRRVARHPCRAETSDAERRRRRQLLHEHASGPPARVLRRAGGARRVDRKARARVARLLRRRPRPAGRRCCSRRCWPRTSARDRPWAPPASATAQGSSAWWWNGSAGIGSLLLAWWIGPRIWREAKRREYLTVGDFIEAHYGRGARALTSALLWVGTLVILAAQLIGVASILHVVAGVPRPAGAALGGVVIVVLLRGGRAPQLGLGEPRAAGRAARRVSSIATPLALARRGRARRDCAVRRRRPPGFLSFTGPHGSGVLLLALLGPAFMVSPGLLQKVYGAVDARAVRVGVAANGLALMCFGFIPPVLGMVARVLHPALAIARPRPADRAGPRSAAGRRIAGARGGVLGRGELRGCGPVHAVHLACRRTSIAAFSGRTPVTEQVLAVARGAAVGGGTRGHRPRGDHPDRDRRPRGVLRAAHRCPLRADRGGAAPAPCRSAPEALASILAGVTVLVATPPAHGRRGARRAGVRRRWGLQPRRAAFGLVLAARWRRPR